MNEQQSGLGSNKHYDARQLPQLNLQTNQAYQRAEALRQAAYEAAHEGDTRYTGHDAGLHLENRPIMSEDLARRSRGQRNLSTRTPVTLSQDEAYELEEDERYYTTRLPTSSRRYQSIPDVRQTYQQGNRTYRYRGDLPQRAHRQLPPPQRERYTEDYELAPPGGSGRQGRYKHPAFWLGLFLTLLVLGWIGLNVIPAWYQGVQNDWTYGKQRHFEINAVVGHGDSATNPSHFTSENNNGEIIVIELPGGNVTKAKIYQIETIPNNVNNPPVKLSFQDINGDGKPDMLVQVGDGSAVLNVVLYNNGTEFVSKL